MTVPINSRELGGTATVIVTIPTWTAATLKDRTPLRVKVLTGATGKVFITLSSELRWKPNRCEDLKKSTLLFLKLCVHFLVQVWIITLKSKLLKPTGNSALWYDS